MERKQQSRPQEVHEPVKPEVNELAERLKEEGNALFRNHNFEEAVLKYTEALNVDINNPQNYIFYSNRATALFYLQRYEDAERGIYHVCSPM